MSQQRRRSNIKCMLESGCLSVNTCQEGHFCVPVQSLSGECGGHGASKNWLDLGIISDVEKQGGRLMWRSRGN